MKNLLCLIGLHEGGLTVKCGQTRIRGWCSFDEFEIKHNVR